MNIIKIILIIYGMIYALVLSISIFKTKQRIKRIFRGKAIGIFGPMGTGKDALQTAVILKLQKYNKSEVYSNIPYKLEKDKFSNILNPRYIDMKDKNAPFPFQEKDIISISEAGMVFPSEDYEWLSKSKIGSIFTTKFIRHLFNGTIIMNEQSPNRIWVQQREKLHCFLKINKMKKGIFWLKFKINYYDNINDYGKAVYSKHELKKLKFNAPQYDGEVAKLSLRFNKRKVFNAYNTRAFAVLAEYKRQNHKKAVKNGKEKEHKVKQFTNINLTLADIKELDLNRLTYIISNDLENQKKENNVNNNNVDNNNVDNNNVNNNKKSNNKKSNMTQSAEQRTKENELLFKNILKEQQEKGKNTKKINQIDTDNFAKDISKNN